MSAFDLTQQILVPLSANHSNLAIASFLKMFKGTKGLTSVCADPIDVPTGMHKFTLPLILVRVMSKESHDMTLQFFPQGNR